MKRRPRTLGRLLVPPGYTRGRVEKLHNRGLRQTEIATLLGISRQAVHQHVQKIREEQREDQGVSA